MELDQEALVGIDLSFDDPRDLAEVDPGGTPLPPPRPSGTGPAPSFAGTNFEPSGALTVPSGLRARAEANLAALEVLNQLASDDRPATRAEQDVLSGWSSWGALPKVFSDDLEWADLRSRVESALTEAERAAARATVLNAHYTDPAVAEAMWSALGQLGFAGGRVLEPGCGSGNFIGAAPASADMVGVELDPVTARIAAALYPQATIRTEGFEQTRLPEASFTAAVGNVPFGGFKLFDPEFNPSGHNIHDHFVIKAIRLTAPGGMVAVVSSTGTMDKRNTAARREMHTHADLVGAVRLPSRAFHRSAGTDVVTDVLIFRRRLPDETPEVAALWDAVTDVATPTGPVTVNQWFADHPGMVLGTMSAGRGMYRDGELVVTHPAPHPGDPPLHEALTEALSALVARARDRGLMMVARPGDEHHAAPAEAAPLLVPRAQPPKPGTITATETGGFARFDTTVGWVDHEVPATQAAELNELLGLRDEVTALIAAQAGGGDRTEVEERRARLNQRYDAYVQRHGPINRYKLTRPAREGAAAAQKRRPPFGGLRKHDPDFQAVAALELFDEETQDVRKAAVFTVDVLRPREPARSAQTPADALAITLDETGRVDLDRIAQLLGTDPRAAQEDLAGLVFRDPGGDDLIPASTYLSGDVRQKLAEAQSAETRQPGGWASNVAALEAVLPADVLPVEIQVKPGVTWIAGSDYAEFVRSLLGIDSASLRIAFTEEVGRWAVNVPTYLRYGVAATATWGTSRRDAIELFTASMNNTPVQVFDTLPDGSRVLDVKATAAAQDKKDAIDRAFAEWVWANPQRARRLGGEYNRRFNSHVAPEFDGTHLSLPGLGEAFTPRAHQRAAVARIVAEPTVLLDHVVGAGKTGTMIMGGMELRRLALVRQPWYVVPNHLVDQFAREFKQWYPQATVLVGGGGMSPAGRREFVAKTAVAEWDAVVVPQSVFKQIPVARRTEVAYREQELAAIETAIRHAREVEGGSVQVKQLEKALRQGEHKLERLRAGAGRDDGVEFEHSGCDYLFIDEAHHYKNRRVPSAVREFDNSATPSQQAEDLAVKLTVLRDRNPGRVATFATATPVANSLREMYVMQAYLRPDLLDAAGVSVFDAWAANFCRSVTALETDVTGTGYRMHTRVAAFVNTPELVAMTRQFSDTVARADLKLPLPSIAGGARRAVVTAPSVEVAAYQDSLNTRAERVRARAVDPSDDNMLKIVNDGRKSALDPRLVGLPGDPGGGRVAAVAEQIMRIHSATADYVFTDPDGQPARRVGALQIVFCDRSTPTGKTEWDFYTGLRGELTAAGMDPRRVRFIHEARNDTERGELFEACRDGRVNVLIGSTEKMGTGVNVQTRAVALHHVDCPWRPADLEQREGRVIRQGNQNTEVEILGYATTGSLGTYMWQTVERKQKFIAQLRAGGHVTRTVEDIGDGDAISYAEFKAAASGNPLIMEREKLANDVARLTTLKLAHQGEQRRLAHEAKQAAMASEAAGHLADQLEAAVARRVDTGGDRFGMILDGNRFSDRPAAATALYHLVASAEHHARRGRSVNRTLGQLGGFDLRIDAARRSDWVLVDFPDIPGFGASVNAEKIGGENPGLGLVRRLELALTRLEDRIGGAQHEQAEGAHRATELEKLLNAPFDRTRDLEVARQRLAEVESALQDSEQPTQPDSEPYATAPPTEAPPPAASVTQHTAHGNTLLADVQRARSMPPPLTPRGI